jgi:hypothetical protein
MSSSPRVGQIFMRVAKSGKVLSAERITKSDWGTYDTKPLKKAELVSLVEKIKK